MSNIIGTVIDIKTFYGNKEANIEFRNGTIQTKLFSLKSDRVYRIPYFQREIRWTKENLIELINDIEKTPKFLGNIILTQDKEGNYDILDGQQRTTIILMLIQYIRKLYADRIEVFSTCDFENCSYQGFSNIYNAYFDESKMKPEELNYVYNSDDYNQGGHYSELWTEISRCRVFASISDAESFLKNLEKCEVNVIVNTGSADQSIDYFLDVNLKGVKLDAEDIFKGYLCAQDDSREIHKLWSDIKKLDARINSDKKIDYPFMLIIEHYLKCVLNRESLYSGIDFGSDFTLKTERKVEGKNYNPGEHIVKVIHNKTYFRTCLRKINDLMEMILIISQEASPTTSFIKYFIEYNKKQKDKDKEVDQDEIAVIYNLLKKILLDKNKVPKCLIVKYIVDVLFNDEIEKDEIRSIYGISSAAILFTLYETQKGSDKIYRIVSKDDWQIEVFKYVSCYFTQSELSNRQIIANYKFVENGRLTLAREKQQFRCKSIATMYNFFNISENRISVKKHKLKELNLFLNDSEKYSVEHFILNDSGKCKFIIRTGDLIEYKYPAEVKPYIDSLFNYIFISRVNNALLEDEIVGEKIELVRNKYKKEFSDEKCEYSRVAIEEVEKIMKTPNVSNANSKEEAEKILNQYYKMEFKNRFTAYATQMIGKITS